MKNPQRQMAELIDQLMNNFKEKIVPKTVNKSYDEIVAEANPQTLKEMNNVFILYNTKLLENGHITDTQAYHLGKEWNIADHNPIVTLVINKALEGKEIYGYNQNHSTPKPQRFKVEKVYGDYFDLTKYVSLTGDNNYGTEGYGFDIGMCFFYKLEDVVKAIESGAV